MKVLIIEAERSEGPQFQRNMNCTGDMCFQLVRIKQYLVFNYSVPIELILETDFLVQLATGYITDTGM